MLLKPNVSVHNLNVFYGKDHVLHDVSVEIPNKKITVIIGPSGCGKTTLLKSFNRLIDSVDGVKVTGEVLVDGENIYDPKAEVTHIRKKMGLLSQRPYPLPMSIYDNVAYGPRLCGEKNKKKLDRIVEHFLHTASLWDEVKDKLNSPAARLSVGQQQRLCLARGLAVGPEIILGDEPTSALDPKSSKHIEERFMELKQYYTIILVTHILRQAKRLADYVLFLYMGRLIEHGPAKEIFENPKEKMTKEYIQGIIS
ncbi:MAG: phosphate ABC transporter ATP-binding protein [Candidatus Omnitrophica bacterium]|nr:phosphate ABC transporter ATP-binding protein [Candidatus Omnitrophota bacterium]